MIPHVSGSTPAALDPRSLPPSRQKGRARLPRCADSPNARRTRLKGRRRACRRLLAAIFAQRYTDGMAPRTEHGRLHGSAWWQRRRLVQLNAEPFCRLCSAMGKVTLADTVDHIEPHHGDLTAFRTGAVQSLCIQCHNGWKQREERDGYQPDIGPDGWPLDARHPVYRAHDPFARNWPRRPRSNAPDACGRVRSPCAAPPASHDLRTPPTHPTAPGRPRGGPGRRSARGYSPMLDADGAIATQAKRPSPALDRPIRR
jgi:5-methylcytosine-specific restriction enzyme A